VAHLRAADRRFTPIASRTARAALRSGAPDDPVMIDYVIRVHPGGAVTPFLSSLMVGDTVSMYPKQGGMDLTQFLETRSLSGGTRRLILVGAGTGITPGIALLQYGVANGLFHSGIKVTFVSILREGEDEAAAEVSRLGALADATVIHYITSGKAKQGNGSSPVGRLQHTSPSGRQSPFANRGAGGPAQASPARLPKVGNDAVHFGRPTDAGLRQALGFSDHPRAASTAIVCGPAKFEQSCSMTLEALGYAVTALTG
jgi:ferredoxin-NADP reductase